ncbi:prepilin peptidase [Leucobacter sp. M11]|uniref:prepilin peptidase n=1 Tax=Leucobacter sp. M11 TaxID=2993565 RepID=UPI002D801368|nr:prepilin peptidase [Leucobacter sp. M11]MEB4615942.1 prepilin peptidase [Leucobacter sp. M11]
MAQRAQMSGALAGALGLIAGLGARILAGVELRRLRGRPLRWGGWPLALFVGGLLAAALLLGAPGVSPAQLPDAPLSRALVQALAAAPLAALAAGGGALAVIDLRTRLLPDRVLLATGAVAVASAALLVVLRGNPGPFLSGIAAGCAVFLALLALSAIAPGQLGGGDVKLGPVLGFVLGTRGLDAVLLGLGAGALLAGLFGVALLIARSWTRGAGAGAGAGLRIPLGPPLLLGAWLGIVLDGLLSAAPG